MRRIWNWRSARACRWRRSTARLPPRPGPRACRCSGNRPGALYRKVFRLRVVDDDGGGRLLGIELVFLAEADADLLGMQQLQQLLLVGEVRAGRVAEGIAAAAIALRQHLVVVARLFGGEAQFAADALVRVFGEGLGHLDREAVQIEVILIAVVGEPLAFGFR